MLRLSRLVDQTVLVCVPSLFADGRVLPCRLVAIELYGLWLQSDELLARMLPHDYAEARPPVEAVSFVPFAQIAAVMAVPGVPAPSPDMASQRQQPEEPAVKPQARPARGAPRRRRSSS